MAAPEVVRVCIGTERKTAIPAQVLMHSILARTKRPVEFTLMDGDRWQVPKDIIGQGTGFSLRRFQIPSVLGYTGRAIYVDADQLCLHDIWDLWTKPEFTWANDGTCVWCTRQPDKFYPGGAWQSSVMVLDCNLARAHWLFQSDALWQYLRSFKPDDRAGYVRVLHLTDMQPAPREIDANWNGLNKYNQQTKLLHYTKEPEQPWYKPDHPHAHLWQEELSAAIKAGAVSKMLFEAGLAAWGIKEDWRPTNGIHGFYRKYLSIFPT